MAEIRLHLDLERASGVLAGIVADLARQGLELKTQKLTRASEGRGGTLDIRAEGDPEDIGALAELMAGARGVAQVVRIEVDGEPAFADGTVILPVAEDDPHEDLEADLDAFLEPEPAPPAPPPMEPETDALLQPEYSEPEPMPERDTDPSPIIAEDDERGPLLHPGHPGHPDDAAGHESDDASVDQSVDHQSVDHSDRAHQEIIDESGRAEMQPSAPAPSDSVSGWGDEQLDDWADELGAAERDDDTDAQDPGLSTESGLTAESSPMPASESESSEHREAPSDSSGTDSRHAASDSTTSSDPNRVEGTLRRRRRRRR